MSLIHRLRGLSEPGAVATGSYFRWLIVKNKRVSLSLSELQCDPVATAPGSDMSLLNLCNLWIKTVEGHTHAMFWTQCDDRPWLNWVIRNEAHTPFTGECCY